MQKFTSGFSSECWEIFIGNQTVEDFMAKSNGMSITEAIGDYLDNTPILGEWRENVDDEEYARISRILIEYVHTESDKVHPCKDCINYISGGGCTEQDEQLVILPGWKAEDNCEFCEFFIDNDDIDIDEELHALENEHDDECRCGDCMNDLMALRDDR